MRKGGEGTHSPRRARRCDLNKRSALIDAYDRANAVPDQKTFAGKIIP